MALREIEIYLPKDSERLPKLEEKYDVLDRRDLTLDNGDRLARLLLDTKDVEALLDWLSKKIGDIEGHRIVVTEVRATLPRQEDEDEDEEEGDDEDSGDSDSDQEEDSDGHEVSRLSREEIYQDVTDSISVSKVHYMLVVLSTIVAAGGMLRDSPAVVIGAMVIAPLIGPNIALALGTTLANWELLKRALKINIIGLFIGFSLAVGVGFFMTVDVSVNEIASRMEVNVGDVALALAAGVAGVLSVTRGVSTALIGVMVAVALLPPLVAMGILVGMGMWPQAIGAAVLTMTNIVAINLAGVVTFLVQGIRPSTWYEEERAKRARLVAIALWLIILALLAAVILVTPPVPL